MVGYLLFPVNESGVDFAETHPAVRARLDHLRAVPGWLDRMTCCRENGCSGLRDLSLTLVQWAQSS
jgi:hypothetical protein